MKFKHHKTTVLLHVEKTQSFTSIKTDLLNALRETETDGTINGTPFPKNPESIIFARQITDSSTSESTWEGLDDDLDEDLFDESAATKGKSKGKAKAGGAKDCPVGAGLKDGCNLAFAFVDDETKAEKSRVGESGKRTDWDVLLPAYEDVYGVEGLQPDPE